ADLWKNDMFAQVRKTWERAGEKALAALDKQFVPAPSSIDRATVFVTIDEKDKEPRAFGVLAFSVPFDPTEVAKVYLPKAEAKQVILALDLGADSKIELRAVYENNAAADDAEKAVKALVDLGRKELTKARKDLEDKLYDPNVKAPRPAEDLPEAIGTVFAIGA